MANLTIEVSFSEKAPYTPGVSSFRTVFRRIDDLDCVPPVVDLGLEYLYEDDGETKEIPPKKLAAMRAFLSDIEPDEPLYVASRKMFHAVFDFGRVDDLDNAQLLRSTLVKAGFKQARIESVRIEPKPLARSKQASVR